MTGQPCIVCNRPDRADIELAMLRHDGGMRSLAAQFGGVSHSALRRHLTNHLGVTVAQSLELRMMLDASNLRDKLAELDNETREMLTEARKAGALRTALVAVHESRGNIEAFARLSVISDLERRVALLEAPSVSDEGDNDGDPGSD